MVVFGQSGCIRAKIVVIRQKWLSSEKNGCIRAKMVLFRAKVVVLRQKWLYSGKVVVFEQK